MKKLLAIILALGITAAAQSATTATLLLRGTIGQVLDLTIDDTLSNKTYLLDLNTSQVDLEVGVVNVRSNSSSGYKLSVSSANSNLLKHANGSSISYILKVGTTVITNTGEITSAATPATHNYPIKVSYTGVSDISLEEGTYQDTITFTLSAN